METSDIAQTDVTHQDDVIGGPMAPVVRHCLEALSTVKDEPVDAVDATGNVEVKQKLGEELIRAYGELSITDKLIVDKQLVDILYLLTTRGFDVNALCDVSKRQTAIHYLASLPDSTRFIRALHAAGAKINAADWHQQTPLHIAAKNADVGNTQALLDCGANINQQDWNQQAPLHLTATGKRHLAVMQLLVRCRADVNATDIGGHTPLHLAAKSGRVAQVRELLLRSTARRNQRDASGQTPLHLAALHDVTGKVLQEFLLRNSKTDVNAVDSVAMETPLHKAIRHDMLENAMLLIKAGSDVNIPDVTGQTSLHCAARTLADLRVWDALMKANGDVTSRTIAGWSVRRMAEESKNSIAKSVLAQYENIEYPKVTMV